MYMEKKKHDLYTAFQILPQTTAMRQYEALVYKTYLENGSKLHKDDREVINMGQR